MAAGIQVFNQGKTIQISSQLTPLFLRKSGQIRTTDAWVHNTSSNICFTQANIDVSDYKCPLVFVRSSHINDRVTPMIWSQGRLKFYRWWNIPLNSNVQYYIFDMWSPPERGKMGLQMWHSETKELIFDSTWYPLQIRKMFSTPVNQPGYEWGTNYAIPIETGMTGNIAVGFSSYRSASLRSSGASSPFAWGWLLRECCWVAGGTVYVSTILTETDTTSWDGNIPTLVPYQHGSKLYVIDTTILPDNYN